LRTLDEKTFRTHDGVSLFYRHWPAQTNPAAGAILLFHRGHEHSGRMAHVVDELDLPEFAFFAWDARGLGRSDGPRGDAPSFGTTVRDVQAFVDYIGASYGIDVQDMAAIAQSVGAVQVAAWVHDYAPKIRAMILASPAFKVKLYVPLARQGLAWQRAWRGNVFVNSYVKARYLTHDRDRIASYESDPLITRPISVDMLLGLDVAANRVVADARAITVPTQLLISGADWVVHQAPQHAFFERLGTPVKERHLFAGFYHDTLGERDRRRPIEQARRFIRERFAEPPVHVPLLDADRLGYTRDEADALATPLPVASPHGLRWVATRFVLKLGGFLSRGIRLGHRTGFDSGSTLDYVYRNEAGGLTPLGRMIDRSYLQAIGWRGIRQRKAHVEELLRAAFARLAAKAEAVRVLDIAAGHGRYVLDALAKTEARPESILLRDYSEINVAAGRRLIDEKGLNGIAAFEQGDAFDAQGLAAIAPRPTVGIVSGLYELFADNALVRRSLSGLAAAIPPGGYLVYTGQPWHPQLEMIARCLTSHRQGQPWIMRRRTQAELDQLVESAGFRKIEQRIDEWGIFTVSLAERVAV
jgi:alpha-beta hydrolase superfamily lysophospholipase